jgi:hypothetical protein
MAPTAIMLSSFVRAGLQAFVFIQRTSSCILATFNQGEQDEYLGLFQQCFNFTWEQKRYGQFGAKVSVCVPCGVEIGDRAAVAVVSRGSLCPSLCATLEPQQCNLLPAISALVLTTVFCNSAQTQLHFCVCLSRSIQIDVYVMQLCPLIGVQQIQVSGDVLCHRRELSVLRVRLHRLLLVARSCGS